jgi:hypothetical protein
MPDASWLVAGDCEGLIHYRGGRIQPKKHPVGACKVQSASTGMTVRGSRMTVSGIRCDMDRSESHEVHSLRTISTAPTNGDSTCKILLAIGCNYARLSL